MRPFIGITVMAVGAALPAACGGVEAAPHSRPPQPASVSVSAYRVSPASCVGRWRALPPGPQRYALVNAGDQPLRVTLIDATSGDVYGQVTQLDPGTHRPLYADPPPGTYRFRCIPRRGVATVSVTARSSGSGGAAGVPLVPLSAEEIDAAVTTYTRAVKTRVARLVTDTDALRRAVAHHRVAAARRRWLTAHLDFASLGAAYGTFGALADEIDGRADGLPGAVDNPRFTGFLAVERLLWHGGHAEGRAAAVDQLASDVRLLSHRLPHLTIIAGDLPLRAHEILENTLQFELTGDTDEGSHTTLATALANVRGTQLVIRALAPTIRLRRPTLLTSIQSGLAGLARDLEATRRLAGRWPAVGGLPRAAHEHLDAEVDGMLEQLAALPGLLPLPASLALP
jgi:high-affinity iron transporter